MNEDKLLNMIKESADSVEVPETLRPEMIEKKLENVHQTSSSRWNYRGKVAAAAAICLCIGIAGMKLIPSGNDGYAEETTTEEAAAEAAAAEILPEAAESKGEPVYASAVDDVYIHAESYEEVYKAIFGDQDYAYADEYGVMEIMEEAEMEAAAEVPAAEESAAVVTDGADVSLRQEAAVETEEAVAEETVVMEGDFSTTNVQEFGIDEADIVKTDGRYIYIVDADKGLRIVKVNQGDMELVSMTPLESLDETIQEMYVDGDTLNLITYGYETLLSEGADSASALKEKEEAFYEESYEVSSQQVIHLYTYDISDRSRVVLEGSVSQAGVYSSSRKAGDIIYLFSQYWPQFCEGADDTMNYIPQVNGDVMPIEDILIPKVSTYDQASLVISSVDITKPDKVVDSKSILAGSNLFYVSASNIYITLTDWGYDHEITNIVRFSYDEDGKIKAEAAGTVRGYLNDSFSLNEHKDHLRVVTTSYDSSRGGELNYLYILDKGLKLTGKIEDLAYQEVIRSARFMGDTGYFVTFRQTDPLFSVDLSNPADPKILGELKVTGFSSYLHFYGEDKLLGIGWEADEDTGITTGMKLSMFDVSDPANVTELHRVVVDDVYECQALNNYKSIMVDAEKNILGFAYIQGTHDPDRYEVEGYYYPVYSYDEEKGFVEEYVYVSDEGMDNGYYYELLQETRGLYIGDWFYLCHSNYITSFDMNHDYAVGSEINW